MLTTRCQEQLIRGFPLSEGRKDVGVSTEEKLTGRGPDGSVGYVPMRQRAKEMQMVAETEQTSVEQQLVVFDPAEQQYGVNISTVREIIRMPEITHVPDAPPSVEGVINLRGGVIPVVDLRKRFSLDVSFATDRSRVVVVELGGDNIGVIVDGVAEVIRIQSDSVEDVASVVTTADSFYIEGIAKIDGLLLILLDLEKALSGETLAKLAVEWAANPPQFLRAVEVDDEVDDDQAPEEMAAELEAEPVTEEKPAAEKKAEPKKVAEWEAPAPSNDPEPLPLNIDLLEATFDAVAPRGDDIVEYFYDQLFEQYPDVMPLFESTDMAKQRGKLLAGLATVVASAMARSRSSTTPSARFSCSHWRMSPVTRGVTRLSRRGRRRTRWSRR